MINYLNIENMKYNYKLSLFITYYFSVLFKSWEDYHSNWSPQSYFATGIVNPSHANVKDTRQIL